jgi:hypothetical protein
MKNCFVDRKIFWIFIGVFVAFKIGLVLAIEYAPSTLSILKHADTGMMIALVFVIGARFADIGWRRWLGIVLALLFAIVLPMLLFFISIIWSPPSRGGNVLDIIPESTAISTLILVILVIVAGVKKTHPRAESRDDLNSDDGVEVPLRRVPPPLI